MSESGAIILFLAAFVAPFTALFAVLGVWWLGIQMHWWR